MELSTPLTVVVTSAWVSLINIVSGESDYEKYRLMKYRRVTESNEESASRDIRRADEVS